MHDFDLYCISHNTFYTRGAAWIAGAYAGETVLSQCGSCKTTIREPSETIRLTPDPEKGSFWPDALGCGGGIMGLYISEPVKAALDAAKARYGKAFKAVVQPPYPKKLQEKLPPTYFHITGEFGANLDFAAS